MRTDDLNVGQWILVRESGQAEEVGQNMFGQMIKRQIGPPADGVPFQISAISLPFICVTKLDGGIGTIDTRTCNLTLAHKTYVKKMQEAYQIERARLAKKMSAPVPQFHALGFGGGEDYDDE